MREATALILTWVSATIITVAALSYSDWYSHGGTLPHILSSGAFIAFVCGMYIFIVGFPILFGLFQLDRISRSLFIIGGMIASAPMALLSYSEGLYSLVVAAITSGITGGATFALLLANTKYT